jgi:phosphoglycerate kinase
MIIGGGLAFTFLKVLNGTKIGNSIFDKEGSLIVEDIIKKAKERNVKLHFPVDFVCGDKIDESSKVKIFETQQGIDDGWSGFDVGPQSNDYFYKVILNAKTVLWNGPPGIFEISHFRQGTISMLKALVEATKNGTITIVGGGETITAVKLIPEAENILTHVSTGGGASLELLEGKKLPGIVYLSDRYKMSAKI